MKLLHQGFRFVAVGGCLVVVDWGVFVGLTALGLATVPANVVGRVVGALLGFWVNGHVTFGERGAPRLGLGRFARYAAFWTTMTIVSTVLVTLVAAQVSLEWAWLAKLVIEGCLAVVSFFVSRHWVYR